MEGRSEGVPQTLDERHAGSDHGSHPDLWVRRRSRGFILQAHRALLHPCERKGKYPEFKGTVRTMEAREFWRDRSVLTSGAGYHDNHNAETCMEVGNALGSAMAGLLNEKND